MRRGGGDRGDDGRPARRWLAAALVFLALPGTACGQADTPFEPPGADDSVRILFIGNSLTEFNDLPGMLASLLESAGVESTVVSLARPAFGLQDHWELASVHERIAQRWDVVILQQGPSATEGRPSLLEYSERFDAEIRAAGGLSALYMVWPAEERSFDFPGVSNSYSEAADRIGGLLFPAGEAWLDAWEADPEVALYGADRFHPSPLGSYLVALVMYEQIAGRDARLLDAPIPGFPGAASEADLETVRTAAHRANLDHRRTPRD